MRSAVVIMLFVVGIYVPTQGGELEEVRRLAPAYGAEVEAPQWDNTRIDMLTDTHAIEVDWSAKWAEAIGQSLYYAAVSGKQPGIILLVKQPAAEQRHVFRCQTVCAKHGIKLWIEVINGNHAGARRDGTDALPALSAE
jgi:hypothetical protein